MNTRVMKWGNSLGVRIPRQIAGKVNLFDGEMIEMNVIGNKIVLEPVNDEYNLDKMLETITNENLNIADWPDDTIGREML